ncbi:MAG TPA: Smr/MutS family protein, partial [Afifellaceae bacterium]|nr:Smr/MutS family protein [Afifellaceae bacterium]
PLKPGALDPEDALPAAAELPKRSKPPRTDAPPKPRPEKKRAKGPPAAVRPTAPSYSPPVSVPGGGSAKPGLAGLEPRKRRRLSRGQAEIDERIDLHGMRQATAFHTLIGFLRQAQQRRSGTVLVITGKGSSGGKHGRDDSARQDGERGVLRRLVPQWLSRGEFRDLVIGFEPASRRHGGDGALYVRIRRRSGSERL